MNITDEMVEAAAKAIEPELERQELVLADPVTLRRLQAERCARAALTAALSDVAGPPAAPPVEYAGLVMSLQNPFRISVFDENGIEWSYLSDSVEDDIARAIDAITALEARAREAEARIRELEAALSDPNAVHLNMLSGRIAKPTAAQIIHLYGDQLSGPAVLAEREACAEAASVWFPGAREAGEADAKAAFEAAIRARTQAAAPAQPVEEAGNG